ncbi:MAG: hypothetical protein GF308_11885 [Candidatus Heimdallarchaeota archaeon]|nr:hypothetical protein [Candidatus Heimdallarchaeota archaeon]
MTMRMLDILQIEEKESFLHDFDPRGKVLLIIALCCLTIYFREIVPLLLLLIFILPFLILGNFFKKWLRSQLLLIPLLLLIILLNALFLKVEHPTTIGIAMALRLVVLVAVFGLFFQTVSPNDLSQMLVKLRIPYSLAWAISTAYRFVPTLAQEATTIMEAQKSRGLQIDRGRLIKRIRNVIPLLVPIFANALRRSWQLAEAIESRGWGATKKKTFFQELSLHWWDIILIILSLGIFGMFLFLVITNPSLPQWMILIIPKEYELKYLLGIVWKWIKNLFT